MLPPDTTATTRRFPALPVRAAATELPPAPSATTRCRSTRSLIADATSRRETTIEPDRRGRFRSHISGSTLLAPEPSTKLGIRVNSCGEPAAKEAASGAAVFGSHAYIFVLGRRHLIAVAMPPISPPPPDRKSTRLNSSHITISYAVFCLKKKKKIKQPTHTLKKKKKNYIPKD